MAAWASSSCTRLAERCFGAAKDFTVLDATTGLGLGVMTGGRLLSGNSGMAGEIGHVTIDPRDELCGCENQRMHGNCRYGRCLVPSSLQTVWDVARRG